MRITASGTAHAAASADAAVVMRVKAGQTYQPGEERDGWVRLQDAWGEAWVQIVQQAGPMREPR